MATNLVTLRKGSGLQIFCKKKDRERESDRYPYEVIEITPLPKNLGIRCFPSMNLLWLLQPISLSNRLCISGSSAQKDSSETGNQKTAEERRLIEGLLDGSGEYTLVYEDNEGDRMLVGDVPWKLNEN
ncbi:hypothetical protein AAC387_Pa05g0852 [Persea americana]